MLLQITLIAGVILLIICLVVRDQTEYRISRLRSEFMFLRSEEKRLAERRDEVELMVSQIGDGLLRADRRRDAIETSADAMDGLLKKLQEMIESGDEGDEGATHAAVATGPADADQTHETPSADTAPVADPVGDEEADADADAEGEGAEPPT